MKCIEIGQGTTFEVRPGKNGRADIYRARVAFSEYDGAELVERRAVNLNLPERYPPGRYSISMESLRVDGYDIKVGFSCKLIPIPSAKPAASSASAA